VGVLTIIAWQSSARFNEPVVAGAVQDEAQNEHEQSNGNDTDTPDESEEIQTLADLFHTAELREGDLKDALREVIAEEFGQDFVDYYGAFNAGARTISQRITGLIPRFVYPGNFGGMYYSDNMAFLNIQFVGSADFNENSAAFIARLLNAPEIRLHLVEFAHRDLSRTMSTINNVMRDGGVAGISITSAWVDTINNLVVVSLMDYSEEEIAAFRREIIDHPAIVFHNTRGEEQRVLSAPLRSHPALDNNVTMEVTEHGENRITVTIFNDTDYELIAGSSFIVESFDGENWWVVPGNYIFTSEAWPIFPRDYTHFPKNLDFHVGTLPPGHYRIRKDIFRNIDIPLDFSNDLHDLVAEFKI
ncbi:MAG: hypothetical protein FWB91_08685, partial [Defluviitaleaceae bacterium]|nr:hypothetical protein [Defluviitaleaceae bacterium]